MRIPTMSKAEKRLPEIALPAGYNYIAAFLTLDCTLSCSYCINRFPGAWKTGVMMDGRRWIAALDRLCPGPDLPVTLQGGEPTLHPDFYFIVRGLRKDLSLDMLTNLEFDIDEFIERIDPARMRRDAPYASIRASYHPETMDLGATVAKVSRLCRAGFSAGLWMLDHPAYGRELAAAREACGQAGIDFRVKEFLGSYNGKMYGTYRYPGAFAGGAGKTVQCRTTELIIGPDGSVYRCHSDLYAGRPPIGSILDAKFCPDGRFRECRSFGACNPCDIKIKTDRFQRSGHTSVEIV